MNRKIIVFFITFVCMVILPVSAYAQDYGTDYPAYIEYSGGAYIEVQSTLGRGTFVLQDTYKSGFIGFYGSAYNICNLSNSTINGKFVASDGDIYDVRFSSFSIPQYYYTSGVTREWRNIYVTEIYNTNCEFIDNTELERDNLLDVFNYDISSYTIVGLLFLIVILLFVLIFKLKGF